MITVAIVAIVFVTVFLLSKLQEHSNNPNNSEILPNKTGSQTDLDVAVALPQKQPIVPPSKTEEELSKTKQELE